MSLYQQGAIEPREAAKCLMQLTANFSQAPAAVFDTFLELARADGWSTERFVAATQHALRTRHFPAVTVADLMDFDRRRRLYTYRQMCDMVNQGIKAFDMYKSTRINGVSYWVGEEY